MNDSFDYVVLGGGSAGYASAALAVRLGLRVAVVDGARDLGGLCILRGCMPSKALLESAHRAEAIRGAGEFGLRAEYFGVDAKAMLARKRRLIAEFADYRRGQLEDGRFTLLRGTAQFIGPRAVEVQLRAGGLRRLEARAFLVATGSEIVKPSIPGLAEAGCLTSDEVLESDALPESVCVLGGGAIALELASYYHGLGVATTIVQRGAQVLRGVDADVAGEVTRGMESRGIVVHRGTKLERIEKAGDIRRVWFSADDGAIQVVEVAEIVCALGRAPATRDLSLDSAGVERDGARILVGPTQQTSAAHIFAAGDVCGPHEVVHLAIQQGEVAARNVATLLGRSPAAGREAMEAMDYALALFAVFTEPQVAVVGLGERQAGERGIDFLVARYPFADHGKAIIHGCTHGFVKLLAERSSRRIIGAACVGPEASELIHEIVVAMRFGATAAQLATTPHYHPTLSEVWTYPAEELAGA